MATTRLPLPLKTKAAIVTSCAFIDGQRTTACDWSSAFWATYCPRN
jgi:hypothetical protein